MKVLLVNPAWPVTGLGARRYRRAWPPLDLLTAAAELRRRGHDPRILDQRARGMKWIDVSREARWADIVMVQTTPLDRWQCPDLNPEPLFTRMASLPSGRLVVAGVHGTLHPEYVLARTGAMAVLRGEPEGPLAALVDAGGNPHFIPGLSRPEAGSFYHEPDAPPTLLDGPVPPAYDLIRADDYDYPVLGPRLAVLETSRGCPHGCVFCLKTMYGSSVRTRPLDRVLMDVDSVVSDWGARSVYFIDLEFTLLRDRALALCRELVRMKPEFQWCCQTRVDAVDMELLTAMKRAGCALVHFGLETGSPGLLEATKKRTTVRQAEEAVNMCRRLGIRTACFFLFGLPGETARDRRAAVSLARRLNPTYASFHPAAPYPGTPMGPAEGFRPSPGVFFAPCLPEHRLDALSRVVRRAWLSFYLRPGYMAGRVRDTSPRMLLHGLRHFRDFIR